MPAISIKVNDTVLKKVITRIPGIGLRIAKEAAFNALSYARIVVPVDTGFLKSSLGVEVDGQVVKLVAMAGYASYVELGTYKMAAQPYLVPAYEQIPWMKIIRAEFRKTGL